MSYFESNETLNNNLLLGSEKLLPYKKAIMKLIYSKCVELSSLESAMDIIDNYKEDGGSVFNVMELNVFLVECATHLLSDFDEDVDLDEDFYDVLEGIFETALKQIKNGDDKLFSAYALRLREIIEVALESGSLYGDRLADIWQEAFGDLE
jgi:hypothetical protein